MGVVKNLMVRIGADVRGVVGGMKTAYSATRQATSQIKNATADMKRSVKDSFSGSRASIREYKETMASLRASQNSAAQNVERLQEKLSNLQRTYDSLKSATADLDLSKPLVTQIQEAEDSWHGFLNEAQKVKEALQKELKYEGDKDNSGKIESLRQDLRRLRTAASEAQLELNNLKSVATVIGAENIKFASVSGMGNLLHEIQSTQQELDVSKIKSGELGQKLRSMSIPNLIRNELKSIGAAAGSAARTGLSLLGSKLKSLGGSAVKRIATLPFKLLHIGKSASSSNHSLEKMVRSIRNIGIVSLGIRVVGGIFRGVFGELQGIISNYVFQNEQLNATISNMKAQLGQALAPAINAIIAAMQRLMPVIQTIAGVINAVFTTLFGKVKTTTSGIKTSTSAAKSAAEQLETYSFDQITKVSDKSEDSSGGDAGDIGSGFDFGATPPWLENVLGWIDKMKEAFKAGDWEGLGRIFGEGINTAVDAINAVDIGAKVGTFVNNLFTTLNSALATINFANIGKKAGEFVTSGFQQVNWDTVGETIGRILTALPSVVAGFILNTDWGLIAQSLSNALGSALGTVGEWIRSVDWLRIGDSIWQFISGIDFGSIASGFFNFFGSALRAGVDIVIGFIGGIVNDIKEFFAKRIEECGGNVVAGFLKGLLDGLLNLGEWIYNNIVNPFFSSFCEGFGIHSPSTIMHEHGGNVIKGFFNGILDALGNIGEWISEHIVSPFLKWIGSLFGISDNSSILKGTGKSLINGLLDGMTETWNSVETFLDSKIAGLETRFTQGWTKIKNATSVSWKEITTAVSDGLKSMQTSAAQQLEIMRQQLVSGWSNIQTDGSAYLSQLVQTVKTDFLTMRSESVRTFNEMRSELQRVWLNLSTQLKSVWTVMTTQFDKVNTHMQTSALRAWDSIWATINERTTSIQTAVESFRVSVTGKWTSILNELASATTQIANIIGEGFANMLMNAQSVLQAIISGVTEMAGAIVDSVASAINAINRLNGYGGSYSKSSSSSSSSGGTVISGHGGSVSYVTGGNYTGGAGGSSMHLATGGVTTGPTYALIGEEGKEAVMPLERHTGWMDTLAQRISAFTGNNGRETPMVFKFYLGGKKISQHVIKDINSITQTTGVCPINV